jgi:galactokinase
MIDLDTFVNTLRTRELFEPGASLTIARAPGRLDVMGGIADYSGSLVLQRPIAEATFAAVQLIDRPDVEIISVGRAPYVVPLRVLAPGGEPLTYDEARQLFASAEHHWAAYVAGLFIVLMRERDVSFSEGARIVIASSVPAGKGVSSSAAIETASMQAIANALGIDLEPRDLALLCQKAENLVAGAPCGVMDQMTCVFGDKDSLLALLCQPATLEPAVCVPDDVALWGLDSGERHAVGGSDYTSVRTGAFMGYRIISEHDGVPSDYLANLSPSNFEAEFIRHLPDEMSGKAFLARYGGTADSVTTVDPSRTYRIRQATSHPVYEHHRVKLFRQQLMLEPATEERRVHAGELMYQSHASYSACGLGSRGTDLLADLVRRQGPKQGLYGARITGGGSGGTVAVLGRSDASAAIGRVVEAYEAATGYRPYVFSGSSPGVTSFGVLKVTL